MKSFIEQAQVYASFHQNTTTRYTHMVGVPLIIVSLMIFLGFVKITMPGVFATNLACLATVALLAYYYRLNWQLALPLTIIMIFLLWIASWFNAYGPTTFSIWVFVITFVVGWGLQLYGHFIEGKGPAFMTNLCQAIIAPMFLMAEAFFMAGYMKPLKDQIYGSETMVVEVKQEG